MTTRAGPENIPGQYTYADGFRYYPTLWFMVDIEFIGYSHNTFYPPHISLSCVAVKLNVEQVGKLQFNKSDVNKANYNKNKEDKSEQDKDSEL